MKKLLIIDNYDSFTYNLYQLAHEIGGYDITVRRNDKLTLDDVAPFDKLLLSPGPGIPSEAGLLLPVIRRYAPTKPILGVCLGHQAIGESFGATLENLTHVYHGIQTPVVVTGGDYLFDGIDSPFFAGRYHSWIVSRENFPPCLRTTAMSDDGAIMALRHNDYDVHGIQFHPESVLTPQGKTILSNFLKH
jgi:anthranilate synthase component 2